MKSQVSPTLGDDSCLEALDLTTLVLWEVSWETSPATHTQGKCSKSFLSIGLKHKQTKPKDVAHAAAQVSLSLFWNSSEAPRFLIEICKMPNSLLSLHCVSRQRQRLFYVTAQYQQHTVRQIDADFIYCWRTILPGVYCLFGCGFWFLFLFFFNGLRLELPASFSSYFGNTFTVGDSQVHGLYSTLRL